MNRSGVLPGVFEAYAACQPAQVGEVFKIMSQQMDRARAGEFSAGELERAKAVIVTTEMMELQTSGARATQAALDELYGLGFDYHDHFAERIEKVTLDEVKAVGRKYLSSPPVIVVVTPSPEDVRLGIEPQGHRSRSTGRSAGRQRCRMSKDYQNLPLADFIADIAAKSPTPGGGSVAAVVGAMGVLPGPHGPGLTQPANRPSPRTRNRSGRHSPNSSRHPMASCNSCAKT